MNSSIYLPASRFLCQQLPFPTSVNSLPKPPVWHQHSAPVPASLDQVLVLMDINGAMLASHAPRSSFSSFFVGFFLAIPGRIIQAVRWTRSAEGFSSDRGSLIIGLHLSSLCQSHINLTSLCQSH